jgi:hypothetical protein
MPKAKLLVIMVPKITFNSGVVTKLEPTITPKRTNVESNNVFIKNLLIEGPLSAAFSESFRKSNK